MTAAPIVGVLRASAFFILMYAAIRWLLRPLSGHITSVVSSVMPTKLVPLVPDFSSHAALLAIAAILTAAGFGFDRRAPSMSGVPFDRAGMKRLAQGMGLGLAGMILVVSVIALLGGYVIVGWARSLPTGLLVAFFCAATYLLVGLSEELWFRGYPLHTLSLGIGFWPAAMVTSLTFGFWHAGNPGETVASELLVSIAGLAVCLLRWLTGSLWFGIGSHAAFDYMESVVFSGSDSGVNMPAEHLLQIRSSGPDWITGGPAGFENSLPGAVTGLLLIILPTIWFCRKSVVRPAFFRRAI